MRTKICAGKSLARSMSRTALRAESVGCFVLDNAINDTWIKQLEVNLKWLKDE